IAAALAFTWIAAAQTPEKRWVPISQHGRTYVDTQTIRYRASDPNYVTFWLKTNERDGNVWRFQFELHRNRLYRILSSCYWNAAGEVISSSDKVSEWTEAAPESVMEVLHDYLFAPPPKAERY